MNALLPGVNSTNINLILIYNYCLQCMVKNELWKKKIIIRIQKFDNSLFSIYLQWFITILTTVHCFQNAMAFLKLSPVCIRMGSLRRTLPALLSRRTPPSKINRFVSHKPPPTPPAPAGTSIWAAVLGEMLFWWLWGRAGCAAVVMAVGERGRVGSDVSSAIAVGLSLYERTDAVSDDSDEQSLNPLSLRASHDLRPLLFLSSLFFLDPTTRTGDSSATMIFCCSADDSPADSSSLTLAILNCWSPARPDPPPAPLPPLPFTTPPTPPRLLAADSVAILPRARIALPVFCLEHKHTQHTHALDHTKTCYRKQKQNQNQLLIHNRIVLLKYN